MNDARSLLRSLRYQRTARVSARAGFIAVDVPAIPAVVRRGQERKIPRDAVVGDVLSNTAGRPRQEVNAVAGLCADVVQSPDDANRDVGDIVVGTTAVRPARLVGAQRGAE